MIIYIRDSLGEELQEELKNDYRQNLRSAEIIQKSSLSNFLLPWGSKTVVWQGRGWGVGIEPGTGTSKESTLGCAPMPKSSPALTAIYFPLSTVIFTSATNNVLAALSAKLSLFWVLDTHKLGICL